MPLRIECRYCVDTHFTDWNFFFGPSEPVLSLRDSTEPVRPLGGYAGFVLLLQLDRIGPRAEFMVVPAGRPLAE